MTTAEHGHSPAQLGLDMQLSTDHLWEHIFSRANMSKALKRVEQNSGAPGVDDMATDALRSWLHVHWHAVKTELDAGTYKPQPVRKVMIPKPGGGERALGVPTVLDRLIQQAICQMLTPIFDPTFSESSFGFRPKRSAHQAVNAVTDHLDSGCHWVIDVDLDKFFDRVNHDVLMARVSQKINDKRVLRLIGKYLRAGVMTNGINQPTELGTPQGSPLSPLLSNVMLDDLDKELESRGHRFVRYADDIRVFVKTKRAAQRVLDGITHSVETKLKLRVNKQKSKFSLPSQSTFLGFCFWRRKGRFHIGIPTQTWSRFKTRIKKLTARAWAISMQHRIELLNRFTRGWLSYFGIAKTPSSYERWDQWIRKRLRQVQWKQWKTVPAKYRNLRALGVSDYDARRWARSSLGFWRIAGSRILTGTLSNTYWQELGFVGLLDDWMQRNPAV